ncbi:MAG: hypothetical protein Q7T54_02810 [Candidatus Levybacteria bacterium]|nr:hypothetical protein [Candidatus Levybacteria bacterium]
MELPNEIPSRFVVIRTLAIEIGIILALTVMVLFALNFLKVIDLKALFAPQASVVKIPSVNKSPQQNQFRPGNATNSAQNNLDFQNLRLIAKSKALHFAQTISEFEGEIKTIETNGGEDNATRRKYEVRIELNIGSESATTVFLIPKEAMEKVKILDSKKEKLTTQDIKVGDKVIIRSNVGALRQYPNNFNEIVITKE